MNPDAMQLQQTIESQINKASFQNLVEVCKPALVDARNRADKELEAMALLGLGEAHLYLGKFHEARVFIDGAIQYAQAQHAALLQAMALNIRAALHMMGTYQTYEANDDYRAALRLAHAAGDLRGTATALAGVASFLNSIGQIERGRRYAREAFEIARELEDEALMAAALGIVGNALQDAHQFEQALKCYRDALAISQSAGVRLTEGVLIGNMGLLHARSNRHLDEGLQMLETALHMAQDIACVPHEFIALYWLGSANIERRKFEIAQDYYATMLQRAQTWHSRPYEATAFYNLGTLNLIFNRYGEAIANYEQAISISQETMNPFHEARAEQAMGAAYTGSRLYDDALGHYMKAQSLYDALDYPERVRDMQKAILMTYLMRLVDGVLRFFGIRQEAPQDDDLPDA